MHVNIHAFMLKPSFLSIMIMPNYYHCCAWLSYVVKQLKDIYDYGVKSP